MSQLAIAGVAVRRVETIAARVLPRDRTCSSAPDDRDRALGLDLLRELLFGHRFECCRVLQVGANLENAPSHATRIADRRGELQGHRIAMNASQAERLPRMHRCQ